MGRRLEGKAAIVTGGGRGIGREIALGLAAEGASVVVADPGVARDGEGTDLAPAEQVAAEIKAKEGKAVPDFRSVVDFQAAGEIVQSCVEHFGRVDIVVNGAGVLRERIIWNLSEEDWDTVLKVHLYGTFNMCRHASRRMREQGHGRMINITSDAWRGTVGQSNYGAAKAGIVGLTRALARELGRYGVTVNSIAPLAATRMTMDEGVKEGMGKRLQAGLITKEAYEAFLRMPGPQYVAPLVTYLASDASADINGQVLHIERGRVSIYSEPVETRTIFKTTEDGMFRVEELEEAVPRTLLVGYVNPAPRQRE